MSQFYTSRSAIETWQQCPRKRWLGYFYQGKGITQVQANVPLTTGTCVHEGIGFLLRNIGLVELEGFDFVQSHWVNEAVQVALASYQKIVNESGITVGVDENSKFVFAQECARTEALIRAWVIAELPMLMRYYTIYSVEDEIVVPLGKEIMFQARVDAILQDKELGRMVNYSLKTMKQYQEGKTDRQFALALQTVTEAWAAEEHLTQAKIIADNFLQLVKSKTSNDRTIATMDRFVAKLIAEPRIYATKHCFLLKGGKSKGDEGNGYIAGDSPLIRGYKSGSGNYCHSYYYPNSNNKSGKGSIGRSWQAFNVWEEMTVKEWIAMLVSKVQDHTGQIIPEIQPECGDIIKQQVVTPTDTFVNREVTESTIRQITSTEEDVFNYGLAIDPEESFGSEVDRLFPMNRQSCLWPTTCEFLPICHLKDWKGDGVSRSVRDDPVGSGFYKIRVPHHKSEKESLTDETVVF